MLGIFDSGIGGLTVVRELLRRHPDADLLYLGDTARTPYGNKSRETIVQYALEDAQFLLSQGAASLVIACNSVSAVAVPALRVRFPGTPIVEVITPAVKDALAATQGRVGVIGTRATIASGIYQEKLSQGKGVTILTQSCPLFVPLVEEGWIEEPETKRIVRHYLSSLRSQNVDTLILGCTHYPLLQSIIQRYMGKRTTIINSAASVVHQLEKEGLISSSATPTQRYWFTDVSPHSVRIAESWLERKLAVEHALPSSFHSG